MIVASKALVDQQSIVSPHLVLALIHPPHLSKHSISIMSPPRKRIRRAKCEYCRQNKPEAEFEIEETSYLVQTCVECRTRNQMNIEREPCWKMQRAIRTARYQIGKALELANNEVSSSRKDVQDPSEAQDCAVVPSYQKQYEEIAAGLHEAGEALEKSFSIAAIVVREELDRTDPIFADKEDSASSPSGTESLPSASTTVSKDMKLEPSASGQATQVSDAGAAGGS